MAAMPAGAVAAGQAHAEAACYASADLMHWAPQGSALGRQATANGGTAIKWGSHGGFMAQGAPVIRWAADDQANQTRNLS